jgi:hypothetical protein
MTNTPTQNITVWDETGTYAADVTVDGKLKVDAVMSSANPLDDYAFSGDDKIGKDTYTLNLKTDGSWYIARYDGQNKLFLYCKGASNYLTAWANKATQTYDYFNNVF